MKYQIIGKNISVTEGISAAIQKKLSKMDKYFKGNDDVLCRAVVRSYKNGAKVEITIFAKNVTFRSEVTNEDLYAAVDFSIDKLLGQMRKFKTQINKKKNSKTHLGEALILEEVEDLPQPSKDEIVRTKTISLDPMDLNDAIARLEAIGHSFFLYLDEEDEKISVVYKREEGGYGLIQAENTLK
ncbi:MAG: ribosome-associated translation inhibitor RaiA [Candidatus Onthovivens sp.]|nr:ribosome-associated translation inhibitor RaiA [Candidatus Onthovivens sp.]